MNSLWYNTPAATWEEALPLGNGRIGAMVHSGVAIEKLCLNEDTLWSGYPQDHNLPHAAEIYKTARQLAMDNKYKEAQELIEENFLCTRTQKYLPLGDLILEMQGHSGQYSNYRRELCLETATHTLKYELGGVEYRRECFISAPDQVLVMRITASCENAISLRAKLDSQLSQLYHSTEDNAILMSGITEGENEPDPSKQGIEFAALAHFEHIGGTAIFENSTLLIENATEVIIRFACRTNFRNSFTPPRTARVPYLQTAELDIEMSLDFDYETLKSRHIADYQPLFNRVDINLGTSLTHLPITERLARWENIENDPGIFALLFQYGRYLMISGSRPGTRPLNLQGIWSPHIDPPWSSNYTVNINAEMNYWPAEVANLAECHKPLISFINDLRTTGAKTARLHYGAGGFVVHHNSDIWAFSTPVDTGKPGQARWSFWPLGAGWLSAHAFYHYEYNMYENYLRNTAFPIIKDAARFFLDVLVEDIDGTLIFAPSTSPENDFLLNDEPLAVSKTTTMTTAIVKETLQNAIKCCKILDIEPEFAAEAEAALSKLPAYQIGTQGELLEWSEEYPEREPHHRHNSHLYPLYPANEITPGTPLAAACAKTLDLRGEEGTGWALAWRICLWARLLNGERAYAFLRKQLRLSVGRLGGCYPNLFGAHPPFQIDSNFGAITGIAEMLLQSPQPGVIHLLPALPKALHTGYAKGLRAKGGTTVDIYFENGELKKASVTLDAHLPAAEFTIMYKDESKTILLTPGNTYNK